MLYGDVYDEACAHALELAEKKGYTFIHPFDDLAVATGQGTIAMEIFKELPLVEYILVPIGGGGLATGVSTLAKLLNPKIKVIGVEPAGANCMQASFAAGKVTTLPTVNTIADGTAVKTPGSQIFPYIQKNLDDIITVTDDELIVSFLDMVENHKMIVENSGLLTVAALKHLNVKDKRVVSILSGGNMDVITMSSVVQQGLIFRISRENWRKFPRHWQKSREMSSNSNTISLFPRTGMPQLNFGLHWSVLVPITRSGLSRRWKRPDISQRS